MKKYKGIWPVVPTVFDDQGNLDLEGQKRTLDFLIDQKVDGACILANYSEQFSLSDEERNLLQKVCINHVAGRMPLIVTISHFSTKIACERAKSALAEGASIVMAMPPYHGTLLKGSPNQILDHFKEMGDVGIPIMLQDAPLSGVPLSVPLLAELAQSIEMLELFKIESIGAAEKIYNLLKLADQHIVCINHVAGRMPLIVTISHFSTKIACERAKSALAEGASIVMAMPPYHGTLLKGSPNQILDHFKEMGDVGIPIMLQDAPLSGVPLSVPLLAELAQSIEMLELFKIESIGAAEKIYNLLKLADQHIEGPFDGEEGITLYADLEAGATGSMTSALIPDLIRPVIISFLTGSKSSAREQYDAVLPIINHENRQCGFRATKEAMVEGGIITSSYCRHPIERLRPQARNLLMELLKIHDPAVLSWGK